MFKIFKKKKKNDWHEIFAEEQKRLHEIILPMLKVIVEKLPSKYEFLKERVTSKLILRCSANGTRYGLNFHDHAFVFAIEPKLEKKFATSINNYLIENIRIFSQTTNRWERVDFWIMNNIPVAFTCKSPDWNFDLDRIDTSDITEKHFGNTEYERWAKVIGKIPAKCKNELDVINGFEIELPEGKYFTLKDFGDGDYIAVKDTGQVYGLIHGRNIIEKIFDSPQEFFAALIKKEFDLRKYYRSKV